MVNVGDELTVPADFDGDVFTLSNGAFNVGGFSHYKFGEHRTKMGQSTSGMSAIMLFLFRAAAGHLYPGWRKVGQHQCDNAA